MDTANKKNGLKLLAKVFIKGKIKTLTGLHIGGSKSSLDIGGVDLNIIKTPQGLPYIPGSSLKGKLRSMLAKIEGSTKVENDPQEIKVIFGDSGDEKDKKGNVTRILVRDAILNEDEFNETFVEDLELGFSEIKTENVINRLSGTAEHPRQLERVPAGASFDFELVYDVYDDVAEDVEEKSTTLTRIRMDQLIKIRTAMRLLKDDYIGGNGSRGYGSIDFDSAQLFVKPISQYKSGLNIDCLLFPNFIEANLDKREILWH